MKQQTTLVPPDQLSSPIPSPLLSPEQQRVNDLKDELKAADPTKQELTFPPVMSDISIPTPKQ